jgi:hypothetical protein
VSARKRVIYDIWKQGLGILTVHRVNKIYTEG